MAAIEQLIRRIETNLDERTFKELFIQDLGWSNPRMARPFRVSTEGHEYQVSEVAQKKGLSVMVVNGLPKTRDAMDDIDREIAKRAIERIVAFVGESEQVWRWPETRKSGGVRFVKHQYRVGAHGQDLPQRLASCKFTMTEEPSMNILIVRERVRTTFNSDEVTKKFYTKFKSHQAELADGIKGLKSETERSWYASLLLNRLMFIYFMQKKGFLNNDPNYLRTSLQKVRALNGRNKFFDFYRDFLLPLFHSGLGEGVTPKVDAKILEILGDVPYINGGIFAEHALEQANTIKIKDELFADVFDFFDQFRWHLDERPSGNPGEINPDVIGYIFEQYINQKQQGAYYTKEDVTGYMTTSALVPVVIDRYLKFDPPGPWSLLASNPDSYIFESLRFGIDFELSDEISQAPRNEAGILDELADAGFGLPGERWREALDRTEYYTDLKGRIASGEVVSSGQLVTLNLDLLSLVCDWIGTVDDPSVIVSMWNDLMTLNVIDPTCGSGAFLFAALDVLEEIYTAVLTRAEALSASATGASKRALTDLIKEVNDHPSRDYFLLKTIVLENLYGVDIMVEATEIARLRLFLALVARLDRKDQIEPLPDLDMNIKVGNILVGCSTIEDARTRFSGNMLVQDQLVEIGKKAAELRSAYDEFVRAQRRGDSHGDVVQAKSHVQTITSDLRDELDTIFHSEVQGLGPFDTWRKKAIPFHWFIEFPETMLSGGFDVVIGNPPYIRKSLLTTYVFEGFKTDNCPDIYAPCVERAISVLRSSGGFSMIVPLSIQFSSKFPSLRAVLLERFPLSLTSAFSNRPAKLFEAEVHPVIFVGLDNGKGVYSSYLNRWQSDFRPYLFSMLRYGKQRVRQDLSTNLLRIGSDRISDFLNELLTRDERLGSSVKRQGHVVGFKTTARYYQSVYLEEPPSWTLSGERTPQTKVGSLCFSSKEDASIGFGLLAGRLANWWWAIAGDDFDVTNGLLESFPISLESLVRVRPKLLELSRDLSKLQRSHPLVSKNAGKFVGNYDLSRCRSVTDQIDQLVLTELGLADYWPTILLADLWLNRSTGEASDERREWPFPL